MLTSFFLLLPHLLRFTLFPYTTLFRSVIEASYLMAYQDGLTGLPARRALTEALQRVNGKFTIAMVDVDHFKKLNDRYGQDRKSTRLNSSHLVNSYAVFCLKKKI